MVLEVFFDYSFIISESQSCRLNVAPLVDVRVNLVGQGSQGGFVAIDMTVTILVVDKRKSINIIGLIGQRIGCLQQLQDREVRAVSHAKCGPICYNKAWPCWLDKSFSS